MDSSIGIGDLAALLTVVGVSTYVLGLVGLAIPISRRFNTDLSTAWYVVSLLPRTIVAGQGIRIWVQWPFFITVVLLLTKWLISPAEDPLELLVMLTVGNGLLIYITRRAALRMLARTSTREGEDNLQRRIFSGIRRRIFSANALAVLGVNVVAVSSQSGVGNSPTYILWVIAGSFLMGVPIALVADPPLPKVEITKQPGATGEVHSYPTEVEGYLVTHSDGFWHLFDGNNKFLSIPDAQVLQVRTLGRQPHPEAEQQRTLEEVMERGADKTK
jgi:hypothetical protein